MTDQESRGPQPDRSELGYDLAHVTPSTVIAALPTAIEPEDIVIREHDGYPPPTLANADMFVALGAIGIAIARGIVAEANSHVILTPRTTWVSGRGYLNLGNGWSVFGDANRADWVKDPNFTEGGLIEIWLHGLTPGEQYLLDVKLTGAGQAAGSAFKLGSSANFWASYAVSGFKAQHLLAVLRPNAPMALVRIEPIDLTFVSFHRAKVKQV